MASGVDLSKLKSRIDAFRSKRARLTERDRTEQAMAIVRIIAGGFMIPHGLSALLGGTQAIAAAALIRNGLDPSSTAVFGIIILEFIGGVSVLVGLFTRVFAGAIAIEMLWVTSTFWSNEADWQSGLWEFPLTLAILMFTVAVFGGRCWSLDRRLGIE